MCLLSVFRLPHYSPCTASLLTCLLVNLVSLTMPPSPWLCLGSGFSSAWWFSLSLFVFAVRCFLPASAQASFWPSAVGFALFLLQVPSPLAPAYDASLIGSVPVGEWKLMVRDEMCFHRCSFMGICQLGTTFEFAMVLPTDPVIPDTVVWYFFSVVWYWGMHWCYRLLYAAFFTWLFIWIYRLRICVSPFSLWLFLTMDVGVVIWCV